VLFCKPSQMRPVSRLGQICWAPDLPTLQPGAPWTPQWQASPASPPPRAKGKGGLFLDALETSLTFENEEVQVSLLQCRRLRKCHHSY
jgi:hypothetical protein